MRITSIAFDLDGTILTPDGDLSPKTRETLIKAAERGIHLIPASGRSLGSFPPEIREMREIRYAVTSNGTAVYDWHTKECLRKFHLTEKAAEQIMRLLKEEDVAYEAFLDGKPYAQREYVENPVSFGASQRAVSYIQSTREPIGDMKQFMRENLGRLDCLDVVVKDEEKKLALWKTLEKKVQDVYITSSVPQLLEISYKEAGKASGVKFLLERLGCRREGLLAFGDGGNDCELLKFAGVGVAMANASWECKQAADFVTETNAEDGAALVIERLCLAD